MLNYLFVSSVLTLELRQLGTPLPLINAQN